MWIDNRGWIYFVRSGIGGEQFKGYYAKALEDYTNKIRLKTIRTLDWRDTKEEAEKDLKDYAIKHNLKKVRRIIYG